MSTCNVEIFFLAPSPSLPGNLPANKDEANDVMCFPLGNLEG